MEEVIPSRMETTANVFAKMSFLVLSFSQQILTLLHLNLSGVSHILVEVWEVEIPSGCQQYYKNVRKETKKQSLKDVVP